MKIYEKEYEDVFAKGPRIKHKIENISLFNSEPEGLDAYVRLYSETFISMHEIIFDSLVKLEWLSRRFTYRGKRAEKRGGNGFEMDQAKSLFIRNHVGFDPKLIFMSRGPFASIANYLDDFFPNFDSGNPFKEKYEYPYKYIRMESLILVNKIEGRLKLIEHGEKKKMSLEKFKDFIINQVNCYNYEYGETYFYKFSSAFLPYVTLKNNKKTYEETKAGSVRPRGSKLLSRK